MLPTSTIVKTLAGTFTLPIGEKDSMMLKLYATFVVWNG